jgi:hypothetical protein
MLLNDQQVLPTINYKLPVYNFSDRENPSEFCLAWMKQEFVKPFRYTGNLFHLAILKAGKYRGH